MKKSALIVLIISSIIFVTSLTAGIMLTMRTIGWDTLLSSSRLADSISHWAGQIHWEDNRFGPVENYTIDQVHTIAPQNIDEIRISALSESITIASGSQDIIGRMSGEYSVLGSPIEWEATQQRGILTLKAKYPRHGLRASRLNIEVTIPDEYAGIVSVNTLSGSCEVIDKASHNWSKFNYEGLSGSLTIKDAGPVSLQLSTLSGSLEINQASGPISGDSMSGSLKAHYIALADFDFETLSGNIKLEIPADSQADISFNTLSGSFKNQNLPVEIISQDKRNLKAKLGSGGQQIEAETMSGNFTLTGIND